MSGIQLSKTLKTKNKVQKSKRKSSKSAAANTPPKTPESNRQRAQSEPVDLDEMVDTQNHRVHDEDVISPAETFDTVPLSASSSLKSFDSKTSYHKNGKRGSSHHSRSTSKNHDGEDDRNDYLPVSLLNFDSPGGQNRGNGSSKVVIEHKIKESQKGRSTPVFGGGACGLWWIKPLLLLLFLLVMFGGASSVYAWLFKFPSLNSQIEELEEQLTRLHQEVDRLEGENDRYEGLNDRLNITAGDLANVRDDLNGTVSELEDVASALNTTKDQIVAQIQQLQGQNTEYSKLNEGLNDNVQELAGEVDFFQKALEELANEHSILQTTTDSLQNLAVQFSNASVDQNETLAVLKETLEGFQIENDRLEDFNEKLEKGLDYLNQTLFDNGNLVESSAITLGSITESLGEKVKQQQRSTLQQLEVYYRQVLAGWDCDYRDIFRSEPYGQDFDVSISASAELPSEVQTYIDERILSKLCLDSNDFREYLTVTIQQQSDNNGVTSNRLIRALVLYTEDAMKHYFPPSEATEDGDSDGISFSEWIDASFRCDLLDSSFLAADGIGVRRLRRRESRSRTL